MVDKNGPVPDQCNPHYTGLGPCWMWLGFRDVHGYGHRGLNGRNPGAHRIAWTISKSEIPVDFFVLHKCDNPGCVNPDHLKLGTHSENVADAIKKGRSARGEKQGSSKLTEEAVQEIRLRVDAGEQQVHLAREFRISKTVMSMTVNRKIWRHVE